MPEFCVDCNHDRRDHFDDDACYVSVLTLSLRPFRDRWRRLKRFSTWKTCPCKTYIPEEEA